MAGEGSAEAVRPVELQADVLDDQLIGRLVDLARASGCSSPVSAACSSG
ncbi:hypothetical protein ACFY00_21800 [Kitasatospora sp. NPDC001540]